MSICFTKHERLQLALLIDGDNIASQYADEILTKLAMHGDIASQQVFGHFPSDESTPWNSPAAQAFDIEKVCVSPCGKGSNCTDIALIAQAEALAKAAIVDGICVASSDGDFACLADQLRKANQLFLVAAPMLASRKLVDVCDTYIALDGDFQPPNQSDLSPRQLMLLNDAVAMHKNKNGWAKLSAVSRYLHCHSESFAKNKWGYRKLKTLLNALGCFDVARSRDGPTRTRRRTLSPSTSSDDTVRADATCRKTLSVNDRSESSAREDCESGMGSRVGR